MNFSSLRLCATRAVANSFPHGNFLSDSDSIPLSSIFSLWFTFAAGRPCVCLRWRFMTAQQGQRRRIIETREVEEDVQFKMLSSDLSLLFFASSLCAKGDSPSRVGYIHLGDCALYSEATECLECLEMAFDPFRPSDFEWPHLHELLRASSREPRT